MGRGMIERLFRLDGKVALVTGGSSGLGIHMAVALAEAGARVYITGRDELRLEATVAEMPLGSDCIPIVADVLKKEDVARIAVTVRGRESRLDILVNNAGVMKEMPIDDYSEEEWDRTMNTNVKAAFFLTQALLPLIRAAGSMEDPARIVNIGSGQGLRPSLLDHFPYSVSKAGLHHLTRVLALKLASDGITVNAIAPGMFHTRQNEHFPDELRQRIIGNIPRRRLGMRDDIAAALLFLCGYGGAFVTGEVMTVDGGRALT